MGCEDCSVGAQVWATRRPGVDVLSWGSAPTACWGSGGRRRGGKLKVWNVAPGERVHDSRGPYPLSCRGLQPEWPVLASPGEGGEVWDVASGPEVASLGGSRVRSFALTFSPDGRRPSPPWGLQGPRETRLDVSMWETGDGGTLALMWTPIPHHGQVLLARRPRRRFDVWAFRSDTPEKFHADRTAGGHRHLAVLAGLLLPACPESAEAAQPHGPADANKAQALGLGACTTFFNVSTRGCHPGSGESRPFPRPGSRRRPIMVGGRSSCPS